MGQVSREAKYDKYWDWIGHSNASDEFAAAINMPLRMLTDEQLDELLVEITDLGDPREDRTNESN